MCQDRGGECEGGCTHRGGLLDRVVSGECLPRSGDCGAGIAGSCELLHYAMGGKAAGGKRANVSIALRARRVWCCARCKLLW